MGQAIGKETILQCKVSASPHESIVWKKNGSALPLHMYKYWTELYDEGHHEKTLHLNIIDIDQDDFGFYTCHASNNLGRDSETMFLYGTFFYQYYIVLLELKCFILFILFTKTCRNCFFKFFQIWFNTVWILALYLWWFSHHKEIIFSYLLNEQLFRLFLLQNWSEVGWTFICMLSL